MKNTRLEFHLTDYCNNYIKNVSNHTELLYTYCCDYLRGNYTARTKEVLTRYFESQTKN